jgi:hypothetical protein
VCLCVFIIIWTLLVFICYLRKWLFCCCRFTLCFSLVDKEKWDSQNGIHRILKRKDPRYYLSLIHIKSVYFIIMHVVIASIVGFDITWRRYCFVAESVHFVFRVDFKMHVESQELTWIMILVIYEINKYDKPNNKEKYILNFMCLFALSQMFVCTVTKYHCAVNLKFANVAKVVYNYLRARPVLACLFVWSLFFILLIYLKKSFSIFHVFFL